jgi:hypothetical protein
MARPFYITSAFFVSLPLLYVSAVILQGIVTHEKFGLVLLRRWQAQRHGYEVFS